MQFSDRLNQVQTSAIRELFKLLSRPDIISFAGGFPDPALFDVEGLQQASTQALSEHPSAALQYGATEGYDPLREQIAALMHSKGVQNLSANGLIVTTGSQQALDLMAKTLLNPGDVSLVEGPTFLSTIQCFRLYGSQVLSTPIDAEGVDVEALEKHIITHKPKLIYLIPTFSNPSGATLNVQRRLQVLALAVKHKTILVEDDPYGDLYFDEAPPPSLLALSDRVPGSRDWLIHCGSLSKILSPGLRIGWMIAPPDLLARATMCKQFSDAHTSTFAQAVAAQYLQTGRLQTTLNRVRRVYAERACAMGQALTQHLGDALTFTPPQGGLFFWAKLTGLRGQCSNGHELAKRAIEHGVAFVPGEPFFASQPDHRAIRLSFATADVAKIQQGVVRLAQALSGSMPS